MPAYHMRIKDLELLQAAERLLVAQNRPEDRKMLRKELREKHQEERVELRHKNRDARLREKAEKALHDKSKKEPDFWNYFPNHDGRRDTMEAVLVSLGQPKEQAGDVMVTYATWLLTANKMHENGRPKNRWAIMTDFVTTELVENKDAAMDEYIEAHIEVQMEALMK